MASKIGLHLLPLFAGLTCTLQLNTEEEAEEMAHSTLKICCTPKFNKRKHSNRNVQKLFVHISKNEKQKLQTETVTVYLLNPFTHFHNNFREII